MRWRERRRDEADELDVAAVGEQDQRVGCRTVGVEAAGGEGKVLGEDWGEEGEVGVWVGGDKEN